MRQRVLRSATWFLALALAPGCAGREGADLSKADAAVREALRRDGFVHVLVALVPPRARRDPAPDSAHVTAAIAAAQDRVLADLDPADYRNRQRYENIPALAGTLLSERGLAALVAHPDVRRVDPDRGGGGIR